MPASPVHPLPKSLAFLGGHCLPTFSHTMTPVAVVSEPPSRAPAQKPAQSEQSQRLPIRDRMQSERRRHQPVPQVQNRLTEAECYDRSDNQNHHQHLNHSLDPHFISPY